MMTGGKVYTNSKTISSHVAAFQTWGDCARFALVPALDGVAWFAAISCSHVSPYYMQSTKCGPLSEAANRDVSESELQKLNAIFSSWHRPIPDLLTNALAKKTALTYAMSSTEVPGLCLWPYWN